MRLTPRQQLIAVSAVFALALGMCAAAFWFVASAVTRDDAVRADIHARLDAFARDRLRARAFSALRAKRQEDMNRILGLFVDRARPIDFLRTLEDLGRATGNAVAIDVDDITSDPTHLGFRVIVEGSEQNSMVRYVRLLERLPYAITVTEINEENKSPDAEVQAGPYARLVVSLRVRTQ